MLQDSGTTWGNESCWHRVKVGPFRVADCPRDLCKLVEGHGVGLNFQRTVVQGHSFEFSPSIINQYWDCADVVEDEVEITKIDPMVSIIMGGKVRTWLTRYNLRSSHLTSEYSILHKIAMCN